MNQMRNNCIYGNVECEMECYREPNFEHISKAKAAGCKFYCGSDSHHPENFVNIKSIFKRAINILELTENDKWHIG